MIVVEECSIKGKELILEASVDDFEYSKNMSIGGVYIDTDETFVATGPSEEAVFSVSFDTGCTSQDYAEEDDDEDDEEDEAEESENEEDGEGDEDDETTPKPSNRHIRLRVTAKEMGLSSLSENLFIIYIKIAGTPSADTPCGKDREYTTTVAMDLSRVYKNGLRYIKQSSRCEVPMVFCDWYMRFKAVELACQTGNYETAISWWKKLFSDAVVSGSVSDCGCDG